MHEICPVHLMPDQCTVSASVDDHAVWRLGIFVTQPKSNTVIGAPRRRLIVRSPQFCMIKLNFFISGRRRRWKPRGQLSGARLGTRRQALGTDSQMCQKRSVISREISPSQAMKKKVILILQLWMNLRRFFCSESCHVLTLTILATYAWTHTLTYREGL
jgi:hypothetical protein